MINYGKILFYNEQNGNGIAITKDKEKVKFTIEEWNNYDVMPSLGLEVSFTLKNDIATQINTLEKETNSPKIKEISLSSAAKETPKPEEQKPQQYKNKEIQNIGEELNALLKSSSNNLDSLRSKISLSMDINQTMHEYFDNLKKQLHKREGYKKVNGRLNYSLSRRFLWTTFNNLTDIDNNIVTLRIKSISDDLIFVSDLKDNFDKKIQYPLVAFEEIFLASQVEYTIVKQMTQEIIDRLNLLRAKEEKLSAEKEQKKKEILSAKNKDKVKKLTKELKIVNGTYADVVHMMAKLQEIHSINAKRLTEFETNYKDDFYETFKRESRTYQKSIIHILDAQAYLLDVLLWKEAKNSPETLSYFKSLSVDIELNTKTYLKYYLGTLDEGKANKETQDLFALYDHLVEVQKDYVLVITSSAQDAMDYEEGIKNRNKAMVVKSFISELESIKWAMTNTIKVIILEDTLISTSAKKYLDYYHNNIFSKPKIILIGNNQNIKSASYTISKTLPTGVEPRVLANTLTELMNA